MTLIAYFDKSETQDYLTLACFVASRETWNSFEKEWKDALCACGAPQSKKGTPYFHCREAFYNQEGYKGWNAGKVFNLATALYDVIGRHSYKNKESQYDLMAFGRTVKLSDYQSLIHKGVHLRDVELLCLDHCFCGPTCHPLIQEENGRYRSKLELGFDRNEKYHSIINNLKHLKGDKRVYWAELVADIKSVDMKEHCGVQAADMLAWAANRYFTKGHTDRWALEFPAIMLSSAAIYNILNEKTIMILYDDYGRYKEGARLPQIEIKMRVQNIMLGDYQIL